MVKFHQGLDTQNQNAIATMPSGRQKIAFMLSLMVEGDTASWKQQLIKEMLDQALLAGTNPDFGTFRRGL